MKKIKTRTINAFVLSLVLILGLFSLISAHKYALAAVNGPCPSCISNPDSICDDGYEGFRFCPQNSNRLDQQAGQACATCDPYSLILEQQGTYYHCATYAYKNVYCVGTTNHQAGPYTYSGWVENYLYESDGSAACQGNYCIPN